MMNEHDATISDTEALNRHRAAGWWDLIGEQPEYPCTTNQVVRLLRAVEYDVDPDRLLQAVNDGWIPPVPRDAGRLAWDATSVICLASALEARRLWQPFSKVHAHKLTMPEMLRQVCSHNGTEWLNDLHEFDLEGLLGMLVSVSSDQAAVLVMAEALREKLKRANVL